MKPYRAMALLGILAILSCTREIEPEEVERGTLTVRANATVKLSGLSFSWFAGSDRLGIYARRVSDGGLIAENAYYSAYSSTVNSLFKPVSNKVKVEFPEADKMLLDVYYPFRASWTDPRAIPVSVPAVQTIIPGQAPDIKKDNVFTASAVNVGEMDTALEMELLPVAAYLKLSLSSDSPIPFSAFRLEGADGLLAFSDGKYDLLEGKLDCGADGSSSLELTLENSFVSTTSPKDIWVQINPLFAGKTIKFYGKAGNQDMLLCEYVLPEGGFKAGECTTYAVHLEGEYEMEGDLSKNGTANCYIVTEPAMTYSFSALVKGNGNSAPLQWSFEGEAFNTSYDVNIQPVSAALLWYSNPDNDESKSPVVPSSVRFDPASGRISFITPDTFVDGNAVIAAFDASGQILWSWNIWAVENWDCDASASRAGRYVFMDRNLGAISGGVAAAAVSDSKEAARAIGNYYQWGRKDPFPAATGYKGTYQVEENWGLSAWTPLDSYKLSGNKIFTTDRTKNGRMLGSVLGSAYTLEDAVAEGARYPHKWMFGGSNDSVSPQYSWFTAENQFGARSLRERMEWRFLWGSIDNVSNVKTIHDPCPPGWKVPTADAFARVLDDVQLAPHGVSAGQYGLYFPYGGQRKAGFGGSTIVSAADIMLASASVAGSLYPIRASRSCTDAGAQGTCITSYNSYAGAGLQVRCVKEDVASQTSPYGRQTGHRAALMGDSITRTWKDRGRKEFFTDNNYLNKGIDGTTTTNMINRFYADIISDDPQLVVITAGTNDFAQNDSWGSNWDQCNYVSREELLANIALMATVAEDLCGEVIIGSICPSRDMWWKGDEWKAMYNGDWISNKIVAANAILKAFAESKGYGWADYHSVLKNAENNLADQYCWILGTNSDGSKNLDRVHPNYDAFLVMEGILKPLIDSKLYSPDEGKPGAGGIDDIDKEEWQ